MKSRTPRLIPVLVASILALTFVPSAVRADFIVELTIHETADGPATSTIAACSFFVKGTGVLAQTGTVRILLDQGADPPLKVGEAAFSGSQDADGLFEMAAGPIDLGASFTGLFARIVYDDPDYPTLDSASFSVDCPRSYAGACVSKFLPPLFTGERAKSADAQSTKLGQDVPVKLNVRCPDSSYPPAQVFIAKWGTDALGPDGPGKTKSSTYTANVMARNGNHLHYNLDTSGMTTGVWRVRVDLGDGQQHTAWLNLQ